MTRLLIALVVLSVSQVAHGYIVLEDSSGTSGWQASLSGAAIGVTNIVVDGTSGRLSLTLVQDFYLQDGEFDTARITFTQTSASAVHEIVVTSQLTYNHTGLPWTRVTWELALATQADFAPSSTATWNVAPLSDISWVSSDKIYASGGTIAPGAAYTPNGALTINIDPGATNAVFSLKQTVVPEPLTLVVLGVGLVATLRRRGR
jgi:hypothetical protein